MPELNIAMNRQDAIAIFTRTYQALDMLALVDRHKGNSTITVANLYEKFLDKYPEPRNEYCFLNHQFFVGCLLAFIVLPQEIIEGIDDNATIDNLAAEWYLGEVQILLNEKRIAGTNDVRPVTRRLFVETLRNAVAHARFRVADGVGSPLFLFEDRLNENSPVNFQASIPLNNLYGFCKRFNEWIIRTQFASENPSMV
jgi:hypothetical protein